MTTAAMATNTMVATTVIMAARPTTMATTMAAESTTIDGAGRPPEVQIHALRGLRGVGGVIGTAGLLVYAGPMFNDARPRHE
jgi:hypothetical protein